MGTKRFFAVFCLCCVSIWPLRISQAQLQLQVDDQSASAQPDFSQSLSDSQYQQGLPHVADNRTDQKPELEEQRPPTWLEGQSSFSKRHQTTGSQQRAHAPRVPAIPDSDNSFGPPSSYYQPRNPVKQAGIRRVQDDPFGEKQTDRTPAKNQFKPNAVDPNNKIVEPILKPVKPDENPPAVPLPGEFPNTAPQQIPDSIVPYADPPTRDQEIRDPALSADAQFPPKPNSQQPTIRPRLIGPGDDVQSPTPALLQGLDNPPSIIGPERIDASPPAQPPALPPVQPDGKPSLQDKINYDRGHELKEANPLPENIDIRPPSVNMPRIVKPGQLIRDEGYSPQIFPEVDQTQPVPQPSYQPLYQPIPGIESQPPYRRPQHQPKPPYLNLESQPAPGSVIPKSGQPATTSQTGVYSSVVAPVDCNPCNCETVCPNFYFSFHGGWTGLRDLNSSSGGGQFLPTGGTGFSFALGRRNGRNLRTELNVSFHQNEVVGYQSGSTYQALTGELTSIAGMANAYWEFIDVPSCCFKPYLGLGIGFVSIDSEIQNTTGQSIIPVGMDNDSSLAYQWMGGINYKAYRNLDVFAEYRFLGADSFRIDTTGSMSDRYSYKTDNVFLGIRWKY